MLEWQLLVFFELHIFFSITYQGILNDDFSYHPDTSFVEVSPVRFRVHVYFPEQAGAFNLDLELAGVSSKILLKIVFENLICSLNFIRR